VKHFFTDDWEVYRKIIPAERHTIGKKNTVGIEQNNSNVRHYTGRFTRRTKVVSKSIEMINITLLITCYLNEYNGYEIFQKIFLNVFS
jgi:insertion element IS1 protein InsB